MSPPGAAPAPLFEPRWTRPPQGVRAGLSTRHGGVSRPPFASLNVAFTTGDRQQDVVENRRRLGRLGGYDPERAILPVLEHGIQVERVGEEHAGLGALAPAPPLRADGLVTDREQLPLLATAADCAPVFLADSLGRAVGIVHAGWRGAAAGIVQVAVSRLRELLPPGAELLAAVGPCIGPCCFEVGEEVAARFAPAEQRRSGTRRPHVDLPAALLRQLRATGVEVAPEPPPCTACQDLRFFSHRAHGGAPTGRMAAFILKAGAGPAAREGSAG